MLEEKRREVKVFRRLQIVNVQIAKVQVGHRSRIGENMALPSMGKDQSDAGGGAYLRSSGPGLDRRRSRPSRSRATLPNASLPTRQMNPMWRPNTAMLCSRIADELPKVKLEVRAQQLPFHRHDLRQPIHDEVKINFTRD